MLHRLAYASFIGVVRPYLYVECAKAASSSIKHALLTIEGMSVTWQPSATESTLAMSVHDRTQHPLGSLSSVSPHAARSLLSSPDVVRFTAVRNPYARLASAWADKIRMREPSYRATCAEIAEHHGLSGGANAEISFADFVTWMTETQSPATCDAHWRSQCELVAWQHIDYQHVMRVESLERDLQAVLDALDWHEVSSADVLRAASVNESLPIDWRALYDEPLAQRVASWFADDFSTFGYALDSWRREDTRDDAPSFERLEARAIAGIRERNELIARLLEEQSHPAAAKPGASGGVAANVTQSVASSRSTPRAASARLLRASARPLRRLRDEPRLRPRAALETAGLEVFRRLVADDRPSLAALDLPDPHPSMDGPIDVYAIVTDNARLHRQIVQWALAGSRSFGENVRLRVLFVDHFPTHLAGWLKGMGIATGRVRGGWVHRSPHALKLAPFLLPTRAQHVMVVDADLAFVADPIPLLKGGILQAPPNPRAKPEWDIWADLAAAAGIARPFEIGESMLPNPVSHSRETPATNHSGGLVVMDGRAARPIARQWLAWSRWLTEQRPLLGPYSGHIDQLGLALAAHATHVPLTMAPSEVNAILPVLPQLDDVAGIHVSAFDVARAVPKRLDPDGQLVVDGLRPRVAAAVTRLQALHDEAEEIIARLPDVRPRSRGELPW